MTTTDRQGESEVRFERASDVPDDDYLRERQPRRALIATATIAAPLERVFDFFSRAENLERITPAELSFAIDTALPIEMRVGATIDYRLRLNGVPLRWRSRIDAWEPGARFVDVQLRGPYRCWWHEHRFQARGELTWMQDRVLYALPLGPFGELAHALFVRRQLRKIFEHRASVIRDAFGAPLPRNR